jgi:osmotically-inducible protein OsmY
MAAGTVGAIGDRRHRPVLIHINAGITAAFNMPSLPMEDTMKSDHLLRQDVIDELDFEPSINADHIGVAATNGVITLSGFVSTYGEKLMAEKAARRVEGVKAIAEEIEVRLPSDKKVADHEIAQRALDVLRWRVGIPGDRIGIKVEKGAVYLTGTVDWQFQKDEAGKAVSHLTGVYVVQNQIQIKSPIQVTNVREKIQKALERAAELDASRITVRAEGGKVILEGKVRGWFERDLAEQAAWSAPGVTQVLDHIQIGP